MPIELLVSQDAESAAEGAAELVAGISGDRLPGRTEPEARRRLESIQADYGRELSEALRCLSDDRKLR